MSLTQKLAKNTALQVGGRAIGTIFGLVTIAILTRHLGQEGYGQFTTAMTFLQIFGVLVDFGLTLTVVQMISEPRANEERIVGNIFSLRLISGFVFFALAPLVSFFFPYPLIIKLAIAVGSLSFFFMSVSQMFVGVFQKHLAMWRAAAAEVISRAVLLALVALASYMAGGLVLVIWAFVAANLVQLAVTLGLTKKFVRPKLYLDLTIWKDIISRSWPIGVSIFFNLLYLKGDIIILSLMRTQEEVGVYGAAFKVLDVITVIPVMFMGLVLPILVRNWRDGQSIDFKKMIQKTFDFFSIVAIPFSVGAIALGVPLMTLVAGADFAESGRVLKILMPAASILFFGSLYGHTIVAIKKQKIMTWGYIVTAIFSIAGYLIFIPSHGIWGAAWVTVFSESLIALLTFIVVTKNTRILPNPLSLFKAGLASVLMYFVLTALPTLNVLISIILGSIVYFIILYIIKGIKKETIKELFLNSK